MGFSSLGTQNLKANPTTAPASIRCLRSGRVFYFFTRTGLFCLVIAKNWSSLVKTIEYEKPLNLIMKNFCKNCTCPSLISLKYRDFDDPRHWSWSIGEWLQNKSGASTTATCPTGAPSLVCPLFIFLLLPSIFNSSDDARKRERVSSQGIFNYRFFFVPPSFLVRRSR